MIKNIVAYSEEQDQDKAFKEVKEKIDSGGVPKLIIFFSPAKGFVFFSKNFRSAYKKATCIGSTTYVSFSSAGNSNNALEALAVYDGIELSSGTLFEIDHYPMHYAQSIENALTKFKDYKNTVCIQFSTAKGMCEELVQDTFRYVLERRKIQVVGGTAGGENTDAKNYVSLDGEVYNNASVFVMIKNLGGKIITYKENIFKPTKHYCMATDVDCDERRVYSIDDMPSTDAIAMMLNIPPDKLPDVIHDHPFGRITGKDIYITDVDKIMPDKSITCFARVYNRTKMVLLELDDIEKVWKETAENIKKEIPNPSFSLVIQCYVKSKRTEKLGVENSFCEKANKEYGNYIGMSGFGEQINFEHFNDTSVVVSFE